MTRDVTIYFRAGSGKLNGICREANYEDTTSVLNAIIAAAADLGVTVASATVSTRNVTTDGESASVTTSNSLSVFNETKYSLAVTDYAES